MQECSRILYIISTLKIHLIGVYAKEIRLSGLNAKHALSGSKMGVHQICSYLDEQQWSSGVALL